MYAFLLFATLLSSIEPGPHAVGVRMQGAKTVWYPAEAGGEIVRFRDYVPRLEDVDASLHGMKVSDETIVGIFDTRMLARRDAPKKKGSFPELLIVPRAKQTAADHAVLAELLASHGYAVSLMVVPRIESKRSAMVSHWRPPATIELAKQILLLENDLTSWRFAADVFPDIPKGRRTTAEGVERVLRFLREVRQ